MIVPMKKYAFMVYHKEYDTFLHTLRDVGVVHVKERKKAKTGNAELDDILSVRKNLKTTMDCFKSLNGETEPETTTSLAPARKITKQEGLHLIEKFEALQEKKTQLLAEKQTLQKDIDYMQIWGEFSYRDIAKLKEAGYEMTFFTCPAARYDAQWEDDYNAFQINNHKSAIYFVTVNKAGETLEIEAERPKLPDSGLDMLNAAFEQKEASMLHLDNQLKEMAASDYLTLEAFDKSLQDEFNFSTVEAQAERQVDDKLMFLEGWTLAAQATQMETELDKQGYFFQQLEIQEKDKVPIVLKNNSYARLFEPLTKIFSLPNYTELDPTPLLAPFFMLFFGLCFGDAGYGLLVLVLCTILKFKVSADMKPILSLAQWLGGTTMIVGTLAGTFFGVALVDVPALQSVKHYFLSMNNLMTLSIVIGLIHIVFGKAVAAHKAKVQRGVKYSIAPWAWVFVIASLLLILGLPALDVQLPQTVLYVCYGIAGASALVVLFYNSPGKNVIVNIGGALWATYNVASGMLSDTLSYIRLFAIGLTGGILGGVFNMLGIDLTEGLPIVVRIPLMLIILLLGHGLNIALCMISSIVHPIRLIFVEYFKNSEYEGGGIAFVPFKKV
jgi:V/A-type H+-transporting ATPase subunit I